MKSKSIHLRGAEANAFIAQMHRDEDLGRAFANSCGPARKAIVAEIVRRGVKVSGVCVKCGCTEEDCSQCIARTGEPCSWTDDERTLCSACVATTCATLKFRFRWKANGRDEELIIEAGDYSMACYKLAWRHAMLYGTEFPEDFTLDLRAPEIVE